MKKLVYIQTDMIECNKFAIIEDSLLDNVDAYFNYEPIYKSVK